MSSRKVTYAKLHDGFFVPGFGNFKETLPPDNKTLPALNMEMDHNGALVLSWEVGGTKHTCLIGSANVKVAVFEIEKVSPPVVSESKSA